MNEISKQPSTALARDDDDDDDKSARGTLAQALNGRLKTSMQ